MKRKICVVTTSRADYYIMKGLLLEIRNDRDLQLQIIATGMHLSSRHGSTYWAIEQDGLHIDKKVEMLLDTDSDIGAAKSVGVGIIGLTDAINELRPDIIILLGDRYELLAAGIASLILGIPIAHIHGGETTLGAFDEAVRHSLTKISLIHFAATEEYRKRIIQMGEHPERVFTVGAPGLDAIEDIELFSKEELEKLLSIRLDTTTALVTFHPVTNEKDSALRHITNMCNAIKETGINAVFTSSNADPEGDAVNQYILRFVNENLKKYVFKINLGNQLYCSCMKHLDLMIGNSSSGIIEAPSFKMPFVNIGNRQDGRIHAGNVIDVDYSTEEIKKGIIKASDDSFRNTLVRITNPYRSVNHISASYQIKKTLKSLTLTKESLKKRFCDI